MTAEFDSFYLICAYVPNSGDGLRRLVTNHELRIFYSEYCSEIKMILFIRLSQANHGAFNFRHTGLPNGIHLSAVI